MVLSGAMGKTNCTISLGKNLILLSSLDKQLLPGITTRQALGMSQMEMVIVQIIRDMRQCIQTDTIRMCRMKTTKSLMKQQIC